MWWYFCCLQNYASFKHAVKISSRQLSWFWRHTWRGYLLFIEYWFTVTLTEQFASDDCLLTIISWSVEDLRLPKQVSASSCWSPHSSGLFIEKLRIVRKFLLKSWRPYNIKSVSFLRNPFSRYHYQTTTWPWENERLQKDTKRLKTDKDKLTE